MKRIMKDYFTFSKKERVAVIILLLLIIAFIAMPYFYSVKPKPPLLNKALADFIAQSKTSSAAKDSNTDNISASFSTEEKKNVLHYKLFPFDPNMISADGWKQLGLSDKTIRTVINYRNKGGRFRSPEDIRKIWGINKEEADRLVPFAQVAEIEANKFSVGKDHSIIKNKTPAVIDINTAGMEEWSALPGIGEAMAGRIIRYRERIGGFAGMDQFKKTYGITDSVYQLISPYLRTDLATIPKININTASTYELRTKANIPESVAKAIVVYRQQYGPYTSVADLKKIVFLNDSLFQKLVHFVKVE